MSYIKFDKLKLINLEYALDKEFLRSNRSGSYASTTIIGCNTRKYHGLLVSPQPHIDNENHVLLSTLHETVIQRDEQFNLGIMKYPGTKYNPKGHKYIRDLTADSIPKITYRVGGVILTKELLLTHEDDRTLLRYTLVDAHSPTKLRFSPFLAFRNIHALSKANMYVDKHFQPAQNGASFKMYEGFSPLIMQFSKEVDYVHVPEWYYNIEYIEELNRGYEGREDLFVPGFFELEIAKGESVVVSAGSEELTPQTLIRRFNKEIKMRVPRDSFEHCLINSAQQFIKKRGKRVEIIAGFPWYDRRGRDVFMALPGLTLAVNEPKTAKMIFVSMLEDMHMGLFPQAGYGLKASYNAPDASLWFFWALQQYAAFTKTKGQIWREFKTPMTEILNNFKSNVLPQVMMRDDYLVEMRVQDVALTWMDAYADGKPVLPRYGATVEANALWYNAVCFAVESAGLANDTGFVIEWEHIRNVIKASFNNVFVSGCRKQLADCVDGLATDWSIRANQILAVSLPYSPLSEDKKMDVIDIVKKELLTPRGLRTLSPQDFHYKGSYEGNVSQREKAAFMGSVYPWLFGHYAFAYYHVYGQEALGHIEELLQGFEGVMWEHGVGSISELYDGDPPHRPNGAISHAISVAEILRVIQLLKDKKK